MSAVETKETVVIENEKKITDKNPLKKLIKEKEIKIIMQRMRKMLNNTHMEKNIKISRNYCRNLYIQYI